MRGIFLDVTGRKQAEEANQLLAGEMSHRVKNLLLCRYPTGISVLTSRSAATTTDMAQDLTKRLTALGGAAMISSVPKGWVPGGEAALLGDLLTVLLQVSDDDTGDGSPGAHPSVGAANGYRREQPPRRLLSWCTSWRPTR